MEKNAIREAKTNRNVIMSEYNAINNRQKDAIKRSITTATSMGKGSISLSVENMLFELGRTDGFRQDLGACFDNMTILVDQLLRLLDEEIASTKQENNND